jgi:hypothetical protein
MDPNKNDLMFEYDAIFCDVLRDLELDEDENGPVPLQVWEGIAQAIADFSGYRISIQAAVFGPINEEGALHLIEEREVASGEPVFFRKPFKRLRALNDSRSMPRHEGSQTSLRFDIPKHGNFQKKPEFIS